MEFNCTLHPHLHSPLETETGTREDGIAEVPAKGGERILLDHAADGAELLAGLLVVHAGDEGETLEQRQVSPVDALGSVGIIGAEEVGEDGLLGLRVMDIGERGVVVAGLGPMGDRDDALISGIVMGLVLEEVSLGGRRVLSIELSINLWRGETKI